MKKLFSFRSFASNNSNSNPPAAPSSDKDLACREKSWDNDGCILSERAYNCAQDPNESSLKPFNQFIETEDSSKSVHRRSFSLSSSVIDTGFREGNHSSFSDFSRTPSSCEHSPRHARRNMQHHASTPEQCMKQNRGSLAAYPNSHAPDKFDSPNSSRGGQFSSGNSPYSSPVHLRCKAAPLSQFIERNKVLDLYIDGENKEVRSNVDAEKLRSERGTDCMKENLSFLDSSRALKAHSTTPSSPTCSRESLKTYSFREDKEMHYDGADDCSLTSTWRHPSKNIGKPFPAMPEKVMMRSSDRDSENYSMVEDIYMDTYTTSSDNVCQNFLSGNNVYYEKLNGYGIDNLMGGQNFILEHGLATIESEKMIGCGKETDEQLLKKLKEVEKMSKLLERDFEPEEPRSDNLSKYSLFKMIKSINNDRKYLALGLSSQIKSQLAERSAAKERFRLSKLELDTRTRRLEKEKNELQFCLEKELDRRSSDWSIKLEKFQLEEQRLRERVRELAEQNVSLQREISSLKGTELDNQSIIVNSELQLTDLTANLELMKSKNDNLQESLSEMQRRINYAEEDRDCIRRSYHVKERENKELHKLVVRLQRICNEQDKTINGLRQGYADEMQRQSVNKDDQVSRLQMEQLRLTGLEQNLRKELESFKHELESLRHENISLLSRLQEAGNGYGLSSVKLDLEVQARIDCLQSQGFSLFSDIIQFSDELLGFIKWKLEKAQEVDSDFDKHSTFEDIVKSQNLKRRFENFKTSLGAIKTVLEEKSSLHQINCWPAGGGTKQLEDNMEYKLKAETLLTKVLREKLCSKELELQHLQAELASTLRIHDVLQSEIQRLQDEVSFLTHKMKNIELQVLQKDESIKELEHGCQESSKELNATQSILVKMTEERDHLWEQVKGSRESVMLLNHEVRSLKKKIEDLDEDILTKEGQIAILKDSLDKPFNIIDSPRSVKEFSLE